MKSKGNNKEKYNPATSIYENDTSFIHKSEYGKIPDELKQRKQWIVWKKEGHSKIPYNLTGEYKVNAIIPESGNSFDDVVKSVESGNADGIAFAISSEDDYIFIDLDDVVDGEGITEEAINIIHSLHSYTEYSPSKTGFHIICRGDLSLNKGHKKPLSQCGEIEIYGEKRMATFTGEMLDESLNQVVECEEALEELYNSYFPEKQSCEKCVEYGSSVLEDDELIQKASDKNPLFNTLFYDGDISGYGNDDSRADMALCAILAFWSNNDFNQIERLWKQSALYRDKIERADYVDRTIKNSLQAETYTGRREEVSSTQENDDDEEQEERVDSPIYDFPYEVISGIAKDFVELYGEGVEISKVHLYFAFLTCLGSCISTYTHLRDRSKTRPLLYTLILGESDTKKSSAIKETLGFFQKVVENMNVCRGVGSGEGLIEAFNSIQADKKQLLLYYDEFKAFVEKAKIENSSLVGHICSLFEDNRAENRTKKGQQKVENAFLAMLGASTYDTYEKTWCSSFTDQGLNNRMFLVPSKNDALIAGPEPIDDEAEEKLIAQVKRIIEVLSIEGDFGIHIEAEALIEYRKGYEAIREEYRQKDIDLIKRLDWYVMKLSALIALCEGKWRIDKESFDKALKIGEWQIVVRKLLKPIDAENVYAEIEQRILKALENTKLPLTDRDIDRKTKIITRKGRKYYTQGRSNLIRSGEVIKVKKENGSATRLWLPEYPIPQGFIDV